MTRKRKRRGVFKQHPPLSHESESAINALGLAVAAARDLVHFVQLLPTPKEADRKRLLVRSRRRLAEASDWARQAGKPLSAFREDG
jgi:hypothetical protein